MNRRKRTGSFNSPSSVRVPWLSEYRCCWVRSTRALRNTWALTMLRHTKTTAPSNAAISAMRPVIDDFGVSDFGVSDWVWLDMVRSHAAFLTSTMRTLSQRQNTISDTKKTIDGSSKTPSVMCWKCEKNDIERTASMTKPGAHWRTAEMTRSNPAMTNRKLTAVAPMKANTWLLVRAEMAAASARNA